MVGQRIWLLALGAAVAVLGIFPVLAGGSSSPAVISDCNGLKNIAGNLSGSYLLGKNVNAGCVAAPIGNMSAPFTGTFDGGGYTITNLKISSSAPSVGLFATIGSNGVVTNVSLTNVNIVATAMSGAITVGAIAGDNAGTIRLSSAQGAITGRGVGVVVIGGLVGSNEGLISTSQTNVAVVATDPDLSEIQIGGLAGSSCCYSSSANNKIIQSFAVGPVTAGSGEPPPSGPVALAGGLVGQNGGLIQSDYATGNVVGGANSAVGGLVAFSAYNSGSIVESLSTGSVTGGANSYAGGLIGWVYDISVQRSYASGAVSAQSGNAGGLAGEMGGCAPCVAVISQSYATGNVRLNGAGSAGGLVGQMHQFFSGTFNQVDQSYSSGRVTGGTVGGLVGAADGTSTVTNSYWDIQSSAAHVSAGGAGLTTKEFTSGTLSSLAGFDPTVWEPMRFSAISPTQGYYPHLWALPFPITSFPLAGYTPHNVPTITVFDHALRTGPDSGLGSTPLTASLYKNSCDGVVLAFTGQMGQSKFFQDTANCSQAGYTQDSARTPFTLSNFNYVGANGPGEGPAYLNYEGHPGYDYRAKNYTPVLAAVSGVIFYPWRAVGTSGSYDTYCRFHTLAQIPDSAPTYRIYYLHLTTHPASTAAGAMPLCNASNDSDGKTVAFTAQPGCYTLAGQPIVPPTLPLPEGTHVGAGCEIALSGSAGVPGAHLHFEIQQIVPAAALANVSGAIAYFQCFNENNHYSQDRNNITSYCLPADPYGWLGPTTVCGGSPDQWPTEGADSWACITGVPSRRFWLQ